MDFSMKKEVDGLCSSCGTTTKASKTEAVSEEPSILIVQLKRFKENGSKDCRFVNFPVKWKKQDRTLVGVIEHIQADSKKNSGHYTAKCHISDRNKWYHMNDQFVKQWKGKIQSEKAYVLFYAKNEERELSQLRESQDESAQKIMAQSPVPCKQLREDDPPTAVFINTQDVIKNLSDGSLRPTADSEVPKVLNKCASEIVENVESTPQQEQQLLNQQQKQQNQKEQQQKEKNERGDADADVIAEKTIIAELCVDAPTNKVKEILRSFSSGNSYKRQEAVFNAHSRKDIVQTLIFLRDDQKDWADYLKPACVRALIYRVQIYF